MAKYYLESVKIEGFKGFTKPRVIPVEGKNLFIFGENGSGKSSIIEAVRWCLFGGEREETLRNMFYSGDCRVELHLRSQGKMVQLQRRLRPGVGRSNVQCLDFQGQELGITELFPYMSKVGGEGGYIITAVQTLPVGRSRADISHFDQIIYEQLGLIEIADLLEHFEKILEEYEDRMQRLDSGKNNLSSSLRAQWSEIDRQLNNLLKAPPWDSEKLPPTLQETRQKVQDFASHLAERAGGFTPRDGLEFILTQAERLIRDIEERGLEDPQRKAREIRKHIDNLESLWGALKDTRHLLSEQVRKIALLEKELQQVCKGQTLDELKAEYERLKMEVEAKALRLEFLQKAESLAKSNNGCPICNKESESFLSLICPRLEEVTGEEKKLIEQRDEAEKRYSTAERFFTQLKQEKERKYDLEERYKALISELSQLLGLPEESISDAEIERYLLKDRDTLRDLERAIQSFNEWIKDQHYALRNLREELRYHNLRDKKGRLEWWLEKGLIGVQEALQNFDESLDAVREIKENLERVFNEVLDTALPPLSEQISKTYQRLTQQTSFDRVQIEREESPKGTKLSLKVCSERDPERLFDPERVLNGQALKAIQLVPYFAFFPFQAEDLELNLMMLDDPSQTFDTERVRFLFEELKNAALHAQLLIATHEEEKFKSLLEQYISPNQYMVRNVKFLDSINGPSVE